MKFKDYLDESNVNEKIFTGKAIIGHYAIKQPVVAKDKEEAEKKFYKMITLQQKNGHVPKGEIENLIFESDRNINEGISLNDEILGNITIGELIDTLVSNEPTINEKIVMKVYKEILDYKLQDAEDELKHYMKFILKETK